MLFGGFRITADVEVQGEPSGVLCALGDWNGGYALFVDDGRLVFTFSRAGDVLEVAGDREVGPDSRSLSVTCRLTADGAGTFTLLHDETEVGTLAFVGGLPIAIQHGGAGLRLGRDTGLPVSVRYTPPAPWNGALFAVRVETPGGRAPDTADQVRGALHSE
jgi:arylsulfatase